MSDAVGHCKQHGAFRVAVERPGNLHVPTECPACEWIKLRAANRTIRTVRTRVNRLIRTVELLEKNG